MTRIALTLGALALAVAASHPALAAQIVPTSYDMRNGDGQAHSGSWNYWDATYTPCGGTCTTDGDSGAMLSGGSGKLTDGVIATDPWYLVSNTAGTGPHVGWQVTFGPDPAITFHFAGTPTIGEVKLYIDNTLSGGVAQPTNVTIAGTPYAVGALPAGNQAVIDIAGLSLTGSDLSMTIGPVLAGYSWIFVSEVQFFTGGTPAPEPASLALLGAGLAGLGLLRRRRAA